MKINQIMQGDCSIVMKKISNNFVDLILTSPPYDNLRNYDGYNFNFEKIAKELFRVLKDGGVFVWIVSDATIKGSETGTSFKQALYAKEIGFRLHDTMIYQKKSYMPLTHNRYEQSFEYMFVFSKGKPSKWNPIKIKSKTAGTKRNRGGSKQNESSYAERKRYETTVVNELKQSPNIFAYDVGKNDKTKHNAPFPEQLVYDHIISWSNEGDLILDPMMGSGTTGKEAKKLKRSFIGITVIYSCTIIAMCFGKFRCCHIIIIMFIDLHASIPIYR